ncbi:hypothetical protein [Lacticaseibacillus chiayiensis]|uniref:hypothetical protein n=1 Tax=Lacticaseibacillus chiayiensis TaxID=2100821 RepID=UPI0010122C76|nr:hypothetical protein [Lacticaseibacillus chiayiensis]RXT58074.1 hypothetical protein CHT97_08545 [Lacticaseibacillus chiayiensis]
MNNEDNDFILRQIKSFAQGLGYILSKKGDSDETVVVFQDAETSLKKYEEELTQYIKEKGFPEAMQMLKSWRSARISRAQYEKLFSWLQKKRFEK